MSAKLLKADVLFFQRILMVSGYYAGPLDGKWSKAVDDGEKRFDDEYERIKEKQGAFDPRTETAIRTLIPSAQKKARAFMSAAADQSVTCKLISGTRTYAEQDALYAIGRTVQLNKRKVTNAKGGGSNHNFGIAWDVGIFVGGKYIEGNNAKEEKLYTDLGAAILKKVKGLEWGGSWSSFVDNPHYQLPTGKTAKEVRKLFEKGQVYVTG
jgi:peptidoglycan L-alanyl-D-glutamate endopeptidase CwlK